MITRRSALLKGTAAMANGLGRPAPSRYPYPDAPQSVPGLGASSGQVVRARLVIIFGIKGGMFVYSPTPGFGNLIESVAAQAGTDPYGNPYFAGFWSYPPSGNSQFAGLNQGTLYLGNGSLLANMGTVSSPSSGNMLISSPVASDTAATAMFRSSTASGLGVPVLQVGYPANATLLTATDPNTGNAAGWNPMTGLQNGWSSAGRHARYRLKPDGNVQLDLEISGGTIANGTVIWTAPADYIPSAAPGTQHLGMDMLEGATGSALDLPRFDITTAGNLIVENLPAGTNILGLSAEYSLT